MIKPSEAWEKCNWYTKWANNVRGYHLTQWVEIRLNPDSLAEGERNWKSKLMAYVFILEAEDSEIHEWRVS